MQKCSGSALCKNASTFFASGISFRYGSASPRFACTVQGLVWVLVCGLVKAGRALRIPQPLLCWRARRSGTDEAQMTGLRGSWLLARTSRRHPPTSLAWTMRRPLVALERSWGRPRAGAWKAAAPAALNATTAHATTLLCTIASADLRVRRMNPRVQESECYSILKAQRNSFHTLAY